ncbi:cell wall-binding repeat-containing protein [Candidatus Poriferisodalis sp.]|uniref:cell wall-binding repeat-containing protein n=1 Tax=Candidatus Poriferisodalis sp. TaxID=3101277 RepID=UPI003B024F55
MLGGGISVWAIPHVGAQSAVPAAPAISSASATLTSATVAWSAPSSDGGSAITAYDLRHITSDATDKSDSQWIEQHDVWATGGGTLSYRQTGLTPSTGYDFQVRAVNANGDGAWSATQTATTGTPAIAGTAALSYAENSAVRVGTFTVTGADDDVDEVTWAVSGTDASHFHINAPKGALRLIDTSDTNHPPRPKLPDYESPDDDGADRSYSITLTATVGGVDATLDVTVALTDVDEPGAIALAPARPKVGTAVTATLSDPDTVSGSTTWVWQRSSGRNSWTTISGATSASYTPAAADSGQYLSARATYTDGHGANKTAETTAHHVVIASVLTGLTASTTDTTLALTPGFEADVLHYKISCGDTDTMTVTPTADTGVRLAIDGTQTTSGTAVDVSVTKDSDVVVRASAADGGFTDYVVHCVQDWLATMEAIDRGEGDVTESLISFALGDYLAVIDHHGVPRFRRQPGATPRFWFRHYRVGSSGEYRWHYTTRPAGGCSTHHILNEDFASLATVSSKSPLRCTGVHDFRILDNGGYLLMSYEPRVNRDISHITLHANLLTGGENAGRVRHRPNDGNLQDDWRATQFTASEGLSDSAIQILTSSQSASRTWRTWGTMAYEDCVQHWWDEYAHLNAVSYFKGSVIGSFRGCSRVLSINASTGKIDWRLGQTNLTAEEWAARNIGPAPLRIVGDPEGEFCGQHAAEMRPDGQDGRLTLFDNNEDCHIDLATGETERSSDEYARAVEYALDLDNNEAVFLRDHSLHGTKDRAGTRGGQVDVLDNGDWLIGWARERQTALQSTKLSPDEAITQVDPGTGTEKLSFKIPARSGSEFQANVRPTAVPAYVLAPQPMALTAAAPASERTSVFHKGDDDTPQVLVTFNRPVVDFAAASPSLSVSGGTITAVSALVADGEPANAYLFTLDPAGEGAVTLRLLANKACADGGICAADGTTLKQALTTVVTPAPLVSFQRAAYSVREGASGSVVVRLSRAHQSASGVTIPVVLDSDASSASQDDFAPDFATAQSVTFQRGETSKTLRIQAVTDTLVEGDEAVALGFGTLPDAIGTGSISSTTVTLTDRTTASFDFRRVDGELAEGASASLSFEITNDVTFAEDATINLTVGGSAIAGDDFTLEDASGSTLSSPYSVTLPAGKSSTSLTIRATDDSAAEPTKETVTIRATLALTNANLGSRTVTIPPSDVANVPDVTIAAGSSVTEGGTASFTLERTGDTTAALTVSVRAVASGAVLSSRAPSSVAFAVGSSTATLSLPTRDDTVVQESGGQVAVHLLGSSSNPPVYLTTPQNSASVVVSDNDVANFTLTSSANRLTEGKSLTLTVDAGGVTFPAAQEIELQLAGTAEIGADYRIGGQSGPSPHRVSLPRGQRSVRVSLIALYDDVADSPADNPETIQIDAYYDNSWFASVDIELVDGTRPKRTGPTGGGGGGSGGGGGGSGGGAGGSSGGLCADGSVVVVANGWSPADIGVASVLAARTRDSAVLYSHAEALPASMARFLRICGPARVVLVGGHLALTWEVRSAARSAADEADVSRISGATRVDTAATVARQILGAAGSPTAATVVVANGWSPADIGAAAALAARIRDSAVVYVSPRGVPEPTRALIAEYRPARILVVGGVSAVTPETAESLAASAPGASIERITGANRAETAANAARHSAPAAGSSISTVVVANGWSPADIGAAAALAARTRDSAVAYVSPGGLPVATRALVAELRPTRIVIVGGAAAVTPEVVHALGVALPRATIERISGADRIATAERVARQVLEDSQP